MVLEGKLGTFKCGCDKHYEGKKGRSGLLLCQGEQAKVGRWGVLCFAKKNGLRGRSLLHQGEWVGGWEMVLCFVKENGLSNDEFSSMSLGQHCTLSTTLGLQHRGTLRSCVEP